MSGISIRHISELPEGRGLETPLHTKRIRNWKPRKYRATPSTPASSADPPLPSSTIPPGHAPSSSAKSTKSPKCKRLKKAPRSRHVYFNGSDSESDDSDNELMDFIGISRTFRSVMETPLDQDTAQDVEFDADSYSDAESDLAADTASDCDSAPEDVPAMVQPTSLYDFDWREFPNPQISPESRRETFSQSNVGPTTPFTDPYDIFADIWDQDIMEHIALETNKYAQQLADLMISNHTLSPNSRISKWKDTTVDELYVYFGLVLAMGVVVKSRLDEYWSTSTDIFHTPGFSAYMCIDRFLLLSKCVHFNDNNDMPTLDPENSDARLFKIQPILSHLNSRFQEMYIPSQNVALDESLLMWKGMLEISQIIPNKIANRGIKSYEICESQTGYLWRFEIHSKKSVSHVSEDPLEASIPSIVLRLIKGLEHKGYTLWMDNYYNSPCLARRVKCLGFDCVGTLRTDRKFVPQSLHRLTKRNMRPGQIAGLTSGDIDVMVWRNNNRVGMLSTYHGNGQQTVGDSTKPILILDYNIMMGGVDKKDQLLALYPIERKRRRVWYKKLFQRLLNVSVLNAYIIHKHTPLQTSLTHRNFRMILIKALLTKHSACLSLPIPTTSKNKPDITHRLSEFPLGPTQRKRRKCANCRRQVSTFCIGCGKTTCMEPCFVIIHS